MDRRGLPRGRPRRCAATASVGKRLDHRRTGSGGLHPRSHRRAGRGHRRLPVRVGPFSAPGGSLDREDGDPAERAPGGASRARVSRGAASGGGRPARVPASLPRRPARLLRGPGTGAGDDHLHRGVREKAPRRGVAQVSDSLHSERRGRRGPDPDRLHRSVYASCRSWCLATAALRSRSTSMSPATTIDGSLSLRKSATARMPPPVPSSSGSSE